LTSLRKSDLRVMNDNNDVSALEVDFECPTQAIFLLNDQPRCIKKEVS